MSTKSPNISEPVKKHEIHALIEMSFIRGYLKGKGYTSESLKSLPEDEARQIRSEASTYASCKLSEIEFKARFAQDLQDASRSLKL